MRIDAWLQHPTPRFLAHDIFEPLRRWTGQELPSEALAIDVTVAALDAAAVDFGLLSAWHAPGAGALISNEEVADWVAAYPDRFAGLAAVDLARPMEAVRELRRCVGELGFVYIDQVAIDFPELTIVGGHVGYPWTEEMIAVCRKHENVYIDTSAYTSKRLPPELVAYMKTRSGRRKVLFGTNHPMIPPVKALEGLEDLGLDDEASDLYLAGNAQRVFGLVPG